MTALDTLKTIDSEDIRYMIECFSKHQLIAIDKFLQLVISGEEPERLRAYIRPVLGKNREPQTRRVTPISFHMDTGGFGTFWEWGEDPKQAQYMAGHLNRNYGVEIEVSRSEAIDAEFFDKSFYDDIAEAIRLRH